MTGRAVGLAASFAIGIVFARIFDPADFGTYKQFFLVYATLYGLVQLGMAESLYYFVPRKAGDTGRYVANAMLTLALAGAVCLTLLYAGRFAIARWLSNTALADYTLLLGLVLTLTLVTTVFEIVMISRKRHVRAAVTYAISDVARTLLFILPALAIGSLRAVFVGAAAFAAIRLLVVLASLWKEFGRDLRIDLTLWRDQLAYALPFALAVGVEIIQINFHQYVVAARVDAATFAIYAIGCLQIPLVDLIVTSTVNVLMVKMGEGTTRPAARALWHDTICRLAFLLVPLAVFLMVMARQVIVGLFTTTYEASVPIFTVWVLAAVLPPMFAVDGVLRVYAQTRFLLLMNVLRLAFVAVFISGFMSAFGLGGAVLVTFIGSMLVKLLGVARVASLMQVSPWEALPWSRLTGITVRAGAAAVPAWWLAGNVAMPPLAALFVAGLVYAMAYFGVSYASMIAPRVSSMARGKRLIAQDAGAEAPALPTSIVES
ncbi:MAG TPA: oligosaccharide flippase family protein [Vicinamibacterales bacterium]